MFCLQTDSAKLTNISRLDENRSYSLQFETYTVATLQNVCDQFERNPNVKKFKLGPGNENCCITVVFVCGSQPSSLLAYKHFANQSPV